MRRAAMGAIGVLAMTMGCGDAAAPAAAPQTLPTAPSGEIEALFVRIADEPNDAIEALDKSLRKGITVFGEAAMNGDSHYRRILSRAVPNLIEALKGDRRQQAWGILVSLQPDCPPPDHGTWVKWWNEKGRSLLAQERDK